MLNLDMNVNSVSIHALQKVEASQCGSANEVNCAFTRPKTGFSSESKPCPDAW